MDKSSAAQLIRAVLDLSGRLNGIDAQLRGIENEAERKSLVGALATIMLELDSGLIRPLVRQYPDLDPDRAHDFG